jgi:hypothetical protein
VNSRRNETSKVSHGDFPSPFFPAVEIFETIKLWYSWNPEKASSIYNMIDYDVFVKLARKD